MMKTMGELDRRAPLVLMIVAAAALRVESQRMDWCEYFAAIGVQRPECTAASLFSPDRLTGGMSGLIRQPPSKDGYGANARLLSSEEVETDDDNDRIGGAGARLGVGMPWSMRLPPSRHGASAWPLCRAHFHSCMRSEACESGTVCRLAGSVPGFGANDGPCCTAPGSLCPPPDQLGISCQQGGRSTNWCHSDKDCQRGLLEAGAVKQVCCPSGCNYNICTSSILAQQSPPGPRWHFHHLHFAMPVMRYPLSNSVVPPGDDGSHCPSPFDLDVVCNSHRPTSWCTSHVDCPSVNVRQPRLCCPTPCNYNVCVVKYTGRWIIA